MIPDERLKEWITACNTERGILENTTIMQIGEALSELLLLREQKRKLVEDGERLATSLRNIKLMFVRVEVESDKKYVKQMDNAIDQHNDLMKEVE